MVGSLWLTLFKVGRPRRRPPAGRGLRRRASSRTRRAARSPTASCSSRDPSPTKDGRPVTITDIWVDSPASVAGGRELWGIPKELCDFSMESEHRGPFTTTEWSARQGRTPIVAATFRDVSRAAPRVPFKGGTWQPGHRGHPRRGAHRRPSRAPPSRCPPEPTGTSTPTARSAGWPAPASWRRSARRPSGCPSARGSASPDRARAGRRPTSGCHRARASRGVRGGRLDRRPLADPDEDVRARDGRPGGLRVVVARHHGHRGADHGAHVPLLGRRAPGAGQRRRCRSTSHPWSVTIIGLVLDDDTDWDEVAELVTESYRLCAPQKLVRQLDQSS